MGVEWQYNPVHHGEWQLAGIPTTEPTLAWGQSFDHSIVGVSATADTLYVAAGKTVRMLTADGSEMAAITTEERLLGPPTTDDAGAVFATANDELRAVTVPVTSSGLERWKDSRRCRQQ